MNRGRPFSRSPGRQRRTRATHVPDGTATRTQSRVTADHWADHRPRCTHRTHEGGRHRHAADCPGQSTWATASHEPGRTARMSLWIRRSAPLGYPGLLVAAPLMRPRQWTESYHADEHDADTPAQSVSQHSRQLRTSALPSRHVARLVRRHTVAGLIILRARGREGSERGGTGSALCGSDRCGRCTHCLRWFGC